MLSPLAVLSLLALPSLSSAEGSSNTHLRHSGGLAEIKFGSDQISVNSSLVSSRCIASGSEGTRLIAYRSHLIVRRLGSAHHASTAYFLPSIVVTLGNVIRTMGNAVVLLDSAGRTA